MKHTMESEETKTEQNMNLENPENLPIKRTTVTELVRVYRDTEEEIRRAFGILVKAEERLKAEFGDGKGIYGFDLVGPSNDRVRFDDPDATMKRLKKDAWRILVERMELRRILSNKRIDELNRQLETGEGMPEIQEDTILGMMRGTLAQAGSYVEELVREVFEWLTPQRGWGAQYKTNSQFDIGRKVILQYCVERNWGGLKWHCSYYREDRLRGLDRVFHALDGKGMPKTYHGPLHAAISACDASGVGETDYFRFKCFKNQNLHIEFKRLDLVQKLNAIAGGMTLKMAAQK